MTRSSYPYSIALEKENKMKTKVRVALLVPSQKIQYGGSTSVIGNKTFGIEIDNAKMLKLAMEGYFKIGENWYCNVTGLNETKADEELGAFIGIAEMESIDPDYIKKLKDEGWELYPEALAFYGLKLP